jgi:hypothetical protein
MLPFLSTTSMLHRYNRYARVIWSIASTGCLACTNPVTMVLLQDQEFRWCDPSSAFRGTPWRHRLATTNTRRCCSYTQPQRHRSCRPLRWRGPLAARRRRARGWGWCCRGARRAGERRGGAPPACRGILRGNAQQGGCYRRWWRMEAWAQWQAWTRRRRGRRHGHMLGVEWRAERRARSSVAVVHGGSPLWVEKCCSGSRAWAAAGTERRRERWTSCGGGGFAWWEWVTVHVHDSEGGRMGENGPARVKGTRWRFGPLGGISGVINGKQRGDLIYSFVRYRGTARR